MPQAGTQSCEMPVTAVPVHVYHSQSTSANDSSVDTSAMPRAMAVGRAKSSNVPASRGMRISASSNIYALNKVMIKKTTTPTIMPKR